MTGLWVSMGLHVAAFLFWLIAGAFTVKTLKRDYADKEAQLEAIYADAKETLEANIKNVQKMAHTANEAYLNNLYGGEHGR